MEEYGELVLRTRPLPSDTNPLGNVLGGWIMTQLDLAGVISATKVTSKFVVTKAMNNILFHKPVMVGHLVSVYAKIEKIGNTSITIKLTMTDNKLQENKENLCVSAEAIFVAVDKNTLRPTKIRISQ